MNTMNRCRSFLLTWALALSGAGLPLLLPAAAQAQGTPRNFPESALRGKLVVTLPPHVTLNGTPVSGSHWRTAAISGRGVRH